MKKTFAFLCLFIAIALFSIASFAQSSSGSNIIALQDSNAFCGTSTFGGCSADSDCIEGGCSGQVCRSASEEEATTTCEWRDCYNNEAYGMQCGCFNSQCQWYAKPAECKGEGETIPVITNPPSCCSGLALIKPKEENWLGIHGYCTAKCGDKICNAEIETNYNCPQDCPKTCDINVSCTLYCQYGFKKDADGCDVCACVEPPAKGVLVLYTVDKYGNNLMVDFFGVIYKLPSGEAVAKIELLNGKGRAELGTGNYTVSVTDYNGTYSPAKTDFSIKGGVENLVNITLYKVPVPVCGNGVCEGSETYDNCQSDCPKPCVCPTIYAPVCGVDGKTYSNKCVAYCANVAIAYEGECKSATIKVELGHNFKLQEKQTAMLLQNGVPTGIDVSLNRINYVKCEPGEVCITLMPSVEVEVRQTDGNTITGTTLYLASGQSGKVFGLTITNLEIGQSYAAFVAKKETEPGHITVKLGEKFNVLEQQTALIQKNNETAIKLRFEGIIKTATCAGGGGSTSSQAVPPTEAGGGSTTCSNWDYAQFNVSFANDGVQYINLREGQSTEASGYKIYLGYLTYSNGKYTATMVVEEVYRPEVVIAYLGVPFNLVKDQSAIVKETSLQLKLVELSGSTAVLEVLQPVTAEPAPSAGGVIARAAAVQPVSAQVTATQKAQIVESVKVSTQQGNVVYNPYLKIRVGAKERIYGYTISFNSIAAVDCVAGSSDCLSGDVANFTVTKDVVPEPKKVYLDQKFDLVQNQTAIVLGIHMQEARAPYEAMRVKLLGISQPSCEAPATDVKKEIMCDARPLAKVEVQLPTQTCESTTGSSECPATASLIVLREGEERTIGSYALRLLDIAGNSAVFIVRASSIPNVIKVKLGENFSLQQEQTAFVVEESLYIRLEDIEMVRCAVAETRCIGGSYASVSVWKEYYEKDLNNVPVSLYKIKEGESLNLYGVKISLLGLGSSAAKFVVTKDTEPIINVHVNDPFKLLLRQAARVLEANIRIDLLNITQLKACAKDVNTEEVECTVGPSAVEISVSNYLFSNEATGKAVKSSDYIESVVEKTSAGTTATSESSEVLVPPMPFRTYTLSEGQSVEVNDFVIKVLSIGYESAEFIVTNKGSGEKMHLELRNGWNLFSIPGELGILESIECSTSDFSIFEYIGAEGRFAKVTDGKAGKAYWLYNPGKGCSVKAIVRKPVSMSEIDALVAGWNFVPVTIDMIGGKIREFGSECGLKAAYFYNADSRRWENASDRSISASDLGKAFALYASNACSLGGTQTEPPMPTLPEVA